MYASYKIHILAIVYISTIVDCVTPGHQNACMYYIQAEDLLLTSLLYQPIHDDHDHDEGL